MGPPSLSAELAAEVAEAADAADAADALAAPVGDPLSSREGPCEGAEAPPPRITFAGEASSGTHFGTVAGAIESGEREARRLLRTCVWPAARQLRHDPRESDAARAMCRWQRTFIWATALRQVQLRLPVSSY